MALDCRSFALYVIKNPRAVALLRRHLLYGNLPHSPLVRTADLDGGESGVDARHSCCTVPTLLLVVRVYLKPRVLVLSNTIAYA